MYCTAQYSSTVQSSVRPSTPVHLGQQKLSLHLPSLCRCLVPPFPVAPRPTHPADPGHLLGSDPSSASRRRGSAPCPRSWPTRAGAGGGGPAPRRTSASSCRRCSPTKAPAKAPTKAATLTGGSKVSATNIFSPTQNYPWSAPPAVCWCGPLRCSSPDYITLNIKTLAFTGTRAMLPCPPSRCRAGYQGNFPYFPREIWFGRTQDPIAV